MNFALANGRELLDFVERLGELEWVKFESRNPVIELRGSSIADDRSKRPPYTSFRFKDESPEVIERLAAAIASYKGEIEWVMVAHDRSPLPGVNWTIRPKLVHDVSEDAERLRVPVGQYCEQRMPELGPLAYGDMLGLVKHVMDVWRATGLSLTH